jgi:hypothetical protein
MRILFHLRGLIPHLNLAQSTPGIFILVISGVLFLDTLTLFSFFILWFPAAKVSRGGKTYYLISGNSGGWLSRTCPFATQDAVRRDPQRRC